MNVSQGIQLALKKLVLDIYKLELTEELIEVEHPDNVAFGDYATNLPLKLARELKQSPLEIAKTLSYEMYEKQNLMFNLSKNDVLFENIQAAQPGFINLKLSKKWLLTVSKEIFSINADYGSSKIGGKKRIALEHSNVNPNKAAHVGHLRNAVIGQFIERVYEFLDYEVEVQYYANDVGVQVATSALGIKYIKDFLPEDYAKFDHYAWDIYAKISSDLQTSEPLKKELEKIMINLENPKSEEAQTQAQLADKILHTQLETFASLDIDYDVVVHERDILYLDFWKDAFEQLKANPNVYLASEGKSKGCWLIKLPTEKKQVAEYVEEDKIIVRSNGVPTYTGKDIAYHMWKFGLLGKDFYYSKYETSTQEKALWSTTSKATKAQNVTFTNADIVYDVIDVKQTYPIEVVKQSLKYLGYNNAAENMVHINYGFVYLSPKTAHNMGIDTSDKKDRYGMSGRKGWGVKVDDLISKMDEALIAEHGYSQTLNHVRNAAIKFEMLRYNTFQDVVFDIESALNIKGYSGPYIQYTYARTCSLLDKSQTEVSTESVSSLILNFDNLELNEPETSILRCMYKFPEIIERSAKEFAPNHLCNYLYDLCQKYNYFYNEVPVLNEQDDQKKLLRLVLNKSVGQILQNGLYLLGITSPTRM